MPTFDDFWRGEPRAELWRHPHRNPPKPAAIAWHRCIKEGADPQRMYDGALGYRQAMTEAGTEPQFWCSAAKFLSEWTFEQYADYAVERAQESQEAKREGERFRERARLGDIVQRRRRELQGAFVARPLTDAERTEADAYLTREKQPKLKVVGE